MKVSKEKVRLLQMQKPHDGGEGGIRTHVALITPKRFRVIVSKLKIVKDSAFYRK